MQTTIKKVIVPTDFSVESLNVVKYLLNQDENCRYDIVLVHGYRLSDSILSLLYMQKNKIYENIIYQNFPEALEVLQSKFQSQISSIRKEIFTGWNKNAFKNFLNGIKAEEVYIPKDYTFQFRNKNSFDIIRMIDKTDLPVTRVAWEMKYSIHPANQLSNIFFTEPSLISIKTNV